MDILSILVGSIIGFLSSIAKDYFIEEKKKKEKMLEFKRVKLEEIFLLMDKLNKNASKPLEMQNLLDAAEVKLPMILRFYFPSLFNDFQVYLKKFQESNPLGDNQEYEKAYQIFMDKVVEESNKLNA